MHLLNKTEHLVHWHAPIDSIRGCDHVFSFFLEICELQPMLREFAFYNFSPFTIFRLNILKIYYFGANN